MRASAYQIAPKMIKKHGKYGQKFNYALKYSMTVTELNFRELTHAQELFFFGGGGGRKEKKKEKKTKFHANLTDTRSQTDEQMWCPIKAFCFYLVKNT